MKVVLYGATGMVGAGVLLECIADPRVTSVLCVGRKPVGVPHPKVKDLLLKDPMDYSGIGNAFAGTDACFWCLGITSLGMDEAAYSRVTVDFTVAGANALASANPTMAFCFVSGASSDSTEKGKVMWARVKGRAENAVFKTFPKSWAFRPGYIQPMKGIKSKTTWINAVYTVMGPLYPLFRPFVGNFATTSENIGIAMIHVALHGEDKKILENGDINRIAAKTNLAKSGK
jgi:uncharacterized protein YbjT (DUF2867 family)